LYRNAVSLWHNRQYHCSPDFVELSRLKKSAVAGFSSPHFEQRFISLTGVQSTKALVDCVGSSAGERSSLDCFVFVVSVWPLSGLRHIFPAAVFFCP
jgi:hypothetical protein